MKNIFLLICLSFSMGMAGAQVKIDRSKQPKAGPAPIITFKDPSTYILPNGITVLVVEDHTLPKVSASLITDAGPIYEGSKAGMFSLMSQMMEEGTTKMDKAKYDAAIDQLGADVSVGASGSGVSALTRYFETAFGLMADAIQNPSFPAASLDKLKSQTVTGLKNSEKSAAAVAGRTLNALSYGKNTALGEFPTIESVQSVTLADIKNAYQTYVSPSRTYLTFVGDITPSTAKMLAEKYLGKWKGPKLSLPSIPNVANPAKSEINFIDMPTAVQAQINVGNVISNPMNNKDYFALLLANQILGGGADSKLFTNLREKHGFTYGSYSNVGSGRFQSLFNASAAVRTDKADSAVAEIVNEILAMRDGKITPAQLATAKAKYNGSFALQMEDPARSARFASNILINNLPKDFYQTYLQKINAVTIDDIKRVSKNYFSEGNSRIAIVGNAEKIIPQLLRLGYPVKKYDIYANPILDEVKNASIATSAATTDKVSAYDVVQAYLKAIGGKDELMKVKSVATELEMDMMGRAINGTDKKMVPNKSLTEMKMGAMTVYKKAFNGTTGYQQQGPQKVDFNLDETKEAAAVKGIFDQLYYTSGSGYAVEYIGAGKVGTEATYRLKVKSPSGKTSVEQYSTKTGLLLQTESTEKAGDQEIDVTITYSDYRKVGNVMMPFKIFSSQAGQEFDMKATSIKINEGVAEEDFK